MKKPYLRYIAFILAAVLIIYFVFYSSIEFLLNFADDDSFFYIKTAYNFSDGFGSTFDRVSMTNGYHPLWFLILSAYFYILNFISVFSPELYFRYTVILILLVNIITLYFISLYFRNVSGQNSYKQTILFLPLFLTFVAIRDFGMETHLLCFLIAGYIYVKSAEVSCGRYRIIIKGILLSLIFLTRIDYLFTVIPLIIISDYLTTLKQYRREYFITSFSILMITAILYFSSNFLFFGEILPVTAKIKSTFPQTLLFHNIGKLLEPGAFTNQFAKTVYLTVIIILFLILSYKGKLNSSFSKTDYFLFGICCAAFAYLALNILINKHALKEWYVAFPAFAGSILMVRILTLIPRMYYLSLTVFILIFSFMFYVTRIKNPKWNSAYYYSKEIKNNTGEEDKIFMIDLSGIIGFFSERKIINGDGLINSYEYQKYLSSGNLTDYFKVKEIDYYSTYSQDNAPFEMIDSSDYYIDEKYSNTFGNYPFIFPGKDLKLKFPYYYSYIIGDGTGYWYLFKLKD
ncbi:MAG TPA: hypothetical protein PKC91_01310 [Ignavibacteria bacterium]|nr:hypothetical protein [Ignavibacteria bacterium]